MTSEELETEDAQAAAEGRGDAEAAAAELGRAAEVLVLRGSPGPMLCDLAAERGRAVIVMGTRWARRHQARVARVRLRSRGAQRAVPGRDLPTTRIDADHADAALHAGSDASPRRRLPRTPRAARDRAPVRDRHDRRCARGSRSTRAAAPLRIGSRSCRWKVGTGPRTAGRPISCAGGGDASATARPGSSGVAKPSRCAPTGGRILVSSVISHRARRAASELRPRAIGDRPAAHPLGPLVAPDGALRPRIAYRHPWLDARVGVDDDAAVITDAELDDLVA